LGASYFLTSSLPSSSAEDSSSSGAGAEVPASGAKSIYMGSNWSIRRAAALRVSEKTRSVAGCRTLAPCLETMARISVRSRDSR
jgi:hypothetical protein